MGHGTHVKFLELAGSSKPPVAMTLWESFKTLVCNTARMGPKDEIAHGCHKARGHRDWTGSLRSWHQEDLYCERSSHPETNSGARQSTNWARPQRAGGRIIRPKKCGYILGHTVDWTRRVSSNCTARVGKLRRLLWIRSWGKPGVDAMLLRQSTDTHETALLTLGLKNNHELHWYWAPLMWLTGNCTLTHNNLRAFSAQEGRSAVYEGSSNKTSVSV